MIQISVYLPHLKHSILTLLKISPYYCIESESLSAIIVLLQSESPMFLYFSYHSLRFTPSLKKMMFSQLTERKNIKLRWRR